jgi:hypothetical protein
MPPISPNYKPTQWTPRENRIWNIVTVLMILIPFMIALFCEVLDAGASGNDCTAWATALGKEGKVTDSKVMHMLGCDDGEFTDKHYVADDGKCAADARSFARQGYWNRPRTVAAMVEAKDHCTVFEDGTYAPPLY